MDAREALARVLLRSEVDVQSEDPWEESGEELHTAYLAAADSMIQAMDHAGWIVVRKPLEDD